MNVLIIDSHNAEIPKNAFNLHLRNSLILKDMFNADLVTLPKHLEPLRDKVYDKILFVHASAYAKANHFVRFIVENSPKADLYYLVNDYYLGEPHALWALCRDYGYKFTCIANHQPEASKVVQKNVKEWHVVNLNCIIYESLPKRKNKAGLFFDAPEHQYNLIYFGAFRTGRVPYFKKYFDIDFPVSTSKKNIEKFERAGIYALWMPRLNWWGTGNTLYDYRFSFYIEDEATHIHYSQLGNRFYEALSYGTPSIFDKSCQNTIDKSGYHINPVLIVDSREELNGKLKFFEYQDIKEILLQDMEENRAMAEEEKERTLDNIKTYISS